MMYESVLVMIISLTYTRRIVTTTENRQANMLGLGEMDLKNGLTKFLKQSTRENGVDDKHHAMRPNWSPLPVVKIRNAIL